MLKRLFANVLDGIIIFAISVLLLLAAEGIMKVIVFKIVDASAFLLIIYAVINVLYFPLLEGGKYATTLGKRLLKLDD